MYERASRCLWFFFFFDVTAPTEIYTLSYTTLFRSLLGVGVPGALTAIDLVYGSSGRISRLYLVDARSEEHTSELQSLTNLVCRLLLEKKKRVTGENPTENRS